MPFCNDCSSGPLTPLSFRRLMDGDKFVYATTHGQLETAIADGCGLCRLMWETWSIFRTNLFEDPSPSDAASFTLSVRAENIDKPDSLVNPEGTQALIIEMTPRSFCRHYIYTSPDDPAATEVVARTPLLEVGSQRAYTLVQESLAECIANHENCPKPDHTTPLPTRVIDCSDPSHPHLFISNGSLAPYVALSYVWGEDQTYSTKTANLDTYINGIESRYIPQTIRDAIEVTNRLDRRYLWVDALCIIQDSDEDKNHELVRMGQIYRDAYLTIVASSATKASAGFLQTRALPKEYTEDLQVQFYCRDGRLGRVSVFAEESDPRLEYEPLREPINCRAWCLQERLLSPRKVVYASHTIQYQCQTVFADLGDAVSGRPKGEQLPDVIFMPTGVVTQLRKSWAWDDWEILHDHWRAAVSNYTRRSLSREEDKLFAFAGVAEEFHRVWRGSVGRYLAGLWERFMPSDLLWERNAFPPSMQNLEDPLRPRFSRSFAPSWSWASVDGHVQLARSYRSTFTKDEKTSECTVLRCDLVLEDGKLPYGHVSGAVLCLRAITLSVPWVGFLEIDPVAYFAHEVLLLVLVPTDMLRSRLEGTNPEEDTGVVVGQRVRGWQGRSVPTHPVVLRKHQLHGSWVVVENGLEEDRSMLTHVSVVGVTFDSPERVRANAIISVVVKWSQEYADGLLVTDAGSGRFRRIGRWHSYVLRGGVDDELVGDHWFVADGSGGEMREIEIV